MKRITGAWVLAASVALIAGCSSSGTKPDSGSTDSTSSGGPISAGGGRGSDSSAISAGRPFSGDPLNDPASDLSKRVVFFDYDEATIRPEATPIINAHARYLADRPNLQITLEGHADERGTREYNLALGERRASAVRQLMMVQGVAPNQLLTVSYGEERPVAMGHDDTAWARNRRVELVYP